MTPAIQRLNIADRYMLVIDRTIRNLGGAGFETLTFVKLNGRVNREHLTRGLTALNRVTPTITARLNEPQARWEMQPEAETAFSEVEFPSDYEAEFLNTAATMFAHETDPVRTNPFRVTLFHLPSGNDVLVAGYSHVLLDHNHAIATLRRIDELGAPGALAVNPPVPEAWSDPIWKHLRQFPRDLRHRAASEVSEFRRTLRGGAAQLGHAIANPNSPRTYAILQRILTAEQTQLAESLAKSVTGMPNLSMALLASAFRGVCHFTANRPQRGSYCAAGIALDLGLKNRPADLLENLATLIPLKVQCADATERDSLVRLLSSQLRGKLSSRGDIGLLTGIAGLGRKRAHADWITHLLMRYCLCFWYGYLGPLKCGSSFCGAPITDVFSAGPTWPTVGVTLLANQYAGRLHLQLTHIEESVPASLAQAYLDYVVADILSSAS